MNRWKFISLFFIAASVLVVGYRAAYAQAGTCYNQPNMANAVQSLRAARGYLQNAEHDKGGWRGLAIQSTDTAISESQRGCAFANAH